MLLTLGQIYLVWFFLMSYYFHDNREDYRKETCTVSHCGNTYFDRLYLSFWSLSKSTWIYFLKDMILTMLCRMTWRWRQIVVCFLNKGLEKLASRQEKKVSQGSQLRLHKDWTVIKVKNSSISLKWTGKPEGRHSPVPNDVSDERHFPLPHR